MVHARSWGALVLVLALAAAGRAQAPSTAAVLGSRDTLRRLEERRDAAAADSFFGGTGQMRKGNDFGGWSTVTFLDLSEIDHDANSADPLESLFVLDLRLWARHTYNDRRHIFVRFRKVDLELDTAPGAVSLDLRTKEQFDLDLGHFEFPIGATQVRIGRLFTRAGRGLVLSDTLDGARFDYRSREGLSLSGFGGSTLHRTDNVDTNVSGFDQGHNDRTFVGLETEYITGSNHRFTLFGIDQNDNVIAANPNQDPVGYRYDSTYVGAGAEGGFGPSTIYSAELVRQTGHAGTQNGGTSREKIEANAALLTVNHRFDGLSLPTLLLDYAFGSGDAGRLSVTDSGTAGPRSGLGDANFLYFGRYDGGFALQPRLSNLHVVRAGFQLHPLAGRLAAPTDLLTGFKVSSYSKQRGAGPISDPLATSGRKGVGIGFDVFSAWKVFSDVDVLFEYGAFAPGNAYPLGTQDEAHKVAISTTIAY